jgi:3-hydroxybutyryl-CoA dehydrogenase
MGNGIAHVFAQHGFKVILNDISNEQLKKAAETIKSNLTRMVFKEKITDRQKHDTLLNLGFSINLEAAVKNADLIIEAITEQYAHKANLFRKLSEFCADACIVATNTSSISITKLSKNYKTPKNVIGMHFMNPVPVMQLVEIINGKHTSKEVTKKVVYFSSQLNKIPIVVNDAPGFISNRILMPMINEAIFSLYEGVAGVKEIDSIMKLGMAHPMGPLQLADHIGLDVCLNIINVLHDGFKTDKYKPCPLLIELVNSGKLGNKTGEGFYTHTKGSKELHVSKRFVN